MEPVWERIRAKSNMEELNMMNTSNVDAEIQNNKEEKEVK
jgi:hypothetical protein